MKPYIITIASNKGGTGKSTIALNIACQFHYSNVKTLLGDGDVVQRALLKWQSVSNIINRPPVREVTTHDGLRIDGGGSYDLIVIDTAARLQADTLAAMICSDLIIIPTSLGSLDLASMRQSSHLVVDVMKARPNIQVRILRNRCRRSASDRLVDRVFNKEIRSFMLRSTLSESVTFDESWYMGTGVVGMAPRSKSSKEVRSLHRELSRISGITTSRFFR